MTVIYNMSIDRADKPWIGDRRLTEQTVSSRPDELFQISGLNDLYLVSHTSSVA